MRGDPFAVLGLPARAGLSDDDVRAAWKRIAAATHPDREDGGDPARFGAAAAAYATLRTSFGRGEALADLGLTGARPGLWGGPGLRGGAGRERRRLRERRGLSEWRRWRFAARVAAATGVSVASVVAAGWTPATVGLLVGALTWAAITSRADPTG
jgi:curved DNA-binding protein CbpA